jgi:cytochrome P450
VLYSIYLTHRDPRYWRSPANFIPERFASEQARQPYTFLPFGGGARNCIGMVFAQVEAKIVLARILQQYALEFTGHRVHLNMGATLEPRPGAWVKVRRRF